MRAPHSCSRDRRGTVVVVFVNSSTHAHPLQAGLDHLASPLFAFLEFYRHHEDFPVTPQHVEKYVSVARSSPDTTPHFRHVHSMATQLFLDDTTNNFEILQVL
ncbi:uncharacterized protein PG986_008509 [Apiospora aurea]|uniref:Uncharacterized protein n=1 Tax=Apiospora aurea TaxID=335848 RepID=A0ABR1QFL8_9PEZI